MGSGLTRLILFFLAPRHLAAIRLVTLFPREKHTDRREKYAMKKEGRDCMKQMR